MRKLLYILILALAATLFAQAQRVKIRFSPESEQFATAAKEYQALWQAEGDKIVKAVESVSRLKFTETEIEAMVFEGVSRSGSPGGSPMKMRASYPAETKKATLIHELGHRHISQLEKRPADIDEHRVLFLFLYDVWEKLYGKKFADEQVEVEKNEEAFTRKHGNGLSRWTKKKEQENSKRSYERTAAVIGTRRIKKSR